MLPVGKVEHIARCNAETHRQQRDGDGVNAQPIPEQGKCQPDGTGKIHVYGFFCIGRLNRRLQQRFKFIHIVFLYVNF